MKVRSIGHNSIVYNDKTTWVEDESGVIWHEAFRLSCRVKRRRIRYKCGFIFIIWLLFMFLTYQNTENLLIWRIKLPKDTVFVTFFVVYKRSVAWNCVPCGMEFPGFWLVEIFQPIWYAFFLRHYQHFHHMIKTYTCMPISNFLK